MALLRARSGRRFKFQAARRRNILFISEQTYPLRRAGQPAELASIYVQLAANDASFTTGNIYGAGGGGGQP